MLITIFTDASYHHQSRAGGWGCWAKHNNGKLFRSGYFEKKIRSSSDAELAAAINGIYLTLKEFNPTSGKIIIGIDNTRAIGMINGSMTPSATEQDMVVELKKLLKLYNMIIEARHVKAHVNRGDRRNFVNNLVDRAAYEEMKKHPLYIKWNKQSG